MYKNTLSTPLWKLAQFENGNKDQSLHPISRGGENVPTTKSRTSSKVYSKGFISHGEAKSSQPQRFGSEFVGYKIGKVVKNVTRIVVDALSVKCSHGNKYRLAMIVML